MTEDIFQAITKILEYSKESRLTSDIARIENDLANKPLEYISEYIKKDDLNPTTLNSAFTVKKAAGQINVIIHALGIINTLPYILEDGEVVEYLSLGAGNTGKRFDLETNKKVAEFKFINWSGKSDTIRQNNTFKDFFELVECDTKKSKYLYILDKNKVMKFFNNNRSLKSVLSKNQSVRDKFLQLYGEKYTTVSEYYNEKKHLIQIIDLVEVVPEIFN